MLAFVYDHGLSLASAEQIARLVGYNKATVGSALDSLTGSGLIHRSRNSHGVRLYRFSETGISADVRTALEELMEVAAGRDGRISLITHLRAIPANDGLHGRGGLHLA